MDKVFRPRYQPIFQVNDVMLGLEVYLLPADFQVNSKAKHYDNYIKMLRHALLHVMSDLESIARLNIKRLFITLTDDCLDHARDLLGFLGERSQALGIKIVVQVDIHQRAEDVDAHPVIKRLMSQGGELALNNFGHYGNGLFQVITTLPRFIKIDKPFLQWCYESKFQNALKDIVTILSDLNCSVIACNPETTIQMQFAYRAGVSCVQGDLLSKPCEIEYLIDEVMSSRDVIHEVA
ncbi:EAL domain-containing protein [Vogesella amnigena]|uniref:EAL domain-containing protein n=1 Tax=Vogesella amnigena TaxID=1507449 RepID=A0ABV7TYK6_9NEIS